CWRSHAFGYDTSASGGARTGGLILLCRGRTEAAHTGAIDHAEVRRRPLSGAGPYRGAGSSQFARGTREAGGGGPWSGAICAGARRVRSEAQAPRLGRRGRIVLGQLVQHGGRLAFAGRPARYRSSRGIRRSVAKHLVGGGGGCSAVRGISARHWARRGRLTKR